MTTVSKVQDGRPWLAQYGPRQPADIQPDFPSIPAAFAALVAQSPGDVIIRYFDAAMTRAELDGASSALAHYLLVQGFQRGDRLVLFMQNNPAFLVGLLGTWKAGGIAVPVNPMNKSAELAHILQDSGARALLCLDALYIEIVAPLLQSGTVDLPIRITFSALDGQSANDARVLGEGLRLPPVAGAVDLHHVLDQAMAVDAALPPVRLLADDTALLTYTSGTTGKPKGAMNTHGNILFNACVFRDWVRLDSGDANLCIAPLFHITGMAAHAALTLLAGCPLLLTHRFHPDVILETIRAHRPAFTIGAITAFISLMNTGHIRPGDFDSFRGLYSGGAPIPPATADAFETLTGHYIRNAYGMTETCSVTLMVPQDARAPVDQASGALSIGVPVFNTLVRILREDGTQADPGEMGELAKQGPQVMKGYWNRPDETARIMRDGFMLSGDVGFMDQEGWFYLVDRKKDMINAGGYKVWPREVEDALYAHPAIREVAVVGVSDTYRGETVKAVVSLKPGAALTESELIAWSRARMASYKYPRIIEFMDDLPKTNTGKILRRNLR